MEFEEWYEGLPSMSMPEPVFARFVWDAAQTAEREACAKLCEEDAFVDLWKGLAEAAKRIRMRSNAGIQPSERSEDRLE